MSDFIVSARKYRPATFSSVVGQKHITSTLKNAIERGQLAHAYLFCGPRGVGKTTCARIFAKAINCMHPEGAEACNTCESCRSFNDGRSLNIHELDAASNNSVEDIRSLIEQVRIIPQVGRYSVFIIDEVHMLSAAAFNAFLKTLEEPPAHVIFILATTEIQKVPETILSRCQRYDFARIVPEDIARRVEYIAGEEHLQLTTEGAELISRLADGAMRDALSILDTCAGVTSQIDASVVRKMAGVTDRSYLFRISDAIAAQDGATALACLAQLRQQRPRPMRQIRLQVAAAEQRLLVDGVEPVKDPLHARGVCDAVHIQHRHRRLRLPADDRLLQLQRRGVQLTPHERGVDAQRLDKGVLRPADGFFDRRLRHRAHIRRAHLERDGLALRIKH